jgi:hypothetical protein
VPRPPGSGKTAGSPRPPLPPVSSVSCVSVPHAAFIIRRGINVHIIASKTLHAVPAHHRHPPPGRAQTVPQRAMAPPVGTQMQSFSERGTLKRAPPPVAAAAVGMALTGPRAGNASPPLASCAEVARNIWHLRADALEERFVLDSACGLFYSAAADGEAGEGRAGNWRLEASRRRWRCMRARPRAPPQPAPGSRPLTPLPMPPGPQCRPSKGSACARQLPPPGRPAACAGRPPAWARGAGLHRCACESAPATSEGLRPTGASPCKGPRLHTHTHPRVGQPPQKHCAACSSNAQWQRRQRVGACERPPRPATSKPSPGSPQS